MSHYGKLLRDVSTRWPCVKCGAAVGERCKTKSGRAVLQPHLYRRRRAREAIYIEGLAR